MKRETIFLKCIIILIGIPVLALCMLGLYWLPKNPVNPDYAPLLYPIIVGIYLTAIPYFFALYKGFRLLSYIDKNIAFSELSVTSLKHIKYCAITISTLYVVMLPFVFQVAQKEDAPGLIIIGMIPILASMVITVFAAVLQKLLENAIDLKNDNDLTI